MWRKGHIAAALFLPAVPLLPMGAKSRSGSASRRARRRKLLKTPERRQTLRQKRLVAALVTAPSIAAAGRAAGYSPSTAYTPSWYRMVRERFLPLALAHCARKGLTLPKVCGRLAESADAEQVVAVNVVGREKLERELVTVPDWDIRMRAINQYFRLAEKMAEPPKEEDAGKIVELHFNFPETTRAKAKDRFRFEVEARR